MMTSTSKIYVAGHQGLVGSALMLELIRQGFTNIITRSSNELDLRNQEQVNTFFAQELPEFVFLAAAKVGGIHANHTYPAQFLYDNVMIEANVIHACHVYNVTKLLFLGSSCIYPRDCTQPMTEDLLLTGPLEPTNEPYALAKIAGIALCKSYKREYGSNFISCMPTNLYGPRDNFDLNNSHVIPALIARIYQAHVEGSSNVSIWGTGNALREFLYVEDCAQALVFLMQQYTETEHINVGTGQELSIKELAYLIARIIEFKGTLIFDTTKPDGTPRKLLDVSNLKKLGWQAHTSLEVGLRKTIEWYIHHYDVTPKDLPKHFNQYENGL